MDFLIACLLPASNLDQPEREVTETGPLLNIRSLPYKTASKMVVT